MNLRSHEQRDYRLGMTVAEKGKILSNKKMSRTRVIFFRVASTARSAFCLKPIRVGKIVSLFKPIGV